MTPSNRNNKIAYYALFVAILLMVNLITDEILRLDRWWRLGISCLVAVIADSLLRRWLLKE